MSEPFMPMRIDSKGKYYTKVVSTQALEVVMRLITGELIQGGIHIRPEHRLSDEMNDDHRFISVTNAIITHNEQEVYRSSYLAVNRREIVWVLPKQAIGQSEEHNYEDIYQEDEQAGS